MYICIHTACCWLVGGPCTQKVTARRTHTHTRTGRVVDIVYNGESLFIYNEFDNRCMRACVSERMCVCFSFLRHH